MFGGATPNRTGTGQPNADGVFADVFDEVIFIAAFWYTCLNYSSRSYCAQKLIDTSLGGPGLGLHLEQS